MIKYQWSCIYIRRECVLLLLSSHLQWGNQTDHSSHKYVHMHKVACPALCQCFSYNFHSTAWPDTSSPYTQQTQTYVTTSCGVTAITFTSCFIGPYWYFYTAIQIQCSILTTLSFLTFTCQCLCTKWMLLDLLL